MKKIYPLFLVFILLATGINAQFTRYVVKLKNKGGASFTIANPSAYLSARAIDRRTRYGIAIDSTDLPVTPSYINQIAAVPNVTVLNASKWLNSVTIQTSDANAVTTIGALPFVQSVAGIAARVSGGSVTTTRDKFAGEQTVTPINFSGRVTADYFNYGSGSYNEIHLHNGEFLHNIGLRGQSMQIAVLDGGFLNYISLRSLDSININNQVLSTWDFVARNASVVEDNSHGMMCLSTIAANIPGQFIGKAPKASFHLYRTEDVASEYPIEEHNWVCGAERADSSGSDVISSSVGYYDFDNATFNYAFSQMNGNTTTSVIGADLAAKKGLIVFNSAGNEGNNSWGRIITPSDGDSVVAVGAVNTAGVAGSFTSRGPSADGRVKPNLSSVGVAAMVQATNNTIGTNNGTSFACPNMAGLATCLWQAFPEFNNMRIIRAMQNAGNLAANPNETLGYGIPDMKTAFTRLLVEFATSSASISNCQVTVAWNTKDVDAMKFEIERKAPGEANYSKVGEAIPVAGNILANHSYTFVNTLTSSLTGNYSYRIRQIVDTATASFKADYIDTANVAVNSSCVTTGTNNPTLENQFVRVQPNPSSGGQVVLVVETPYAVPTMPIMVYDNKGRLIYQLKESKGSGRVNITLPGDRLPRGKYYIEVLNGNKKIGTTELIRL